MQNSGRMIVRNPIFVMLIGVPGSGKSTFVKFLESSGVVEGANTDILSTDAWIESVAKRENKNYGEVFKDEIRNAEVSLENTLRQAIGSSQNIIWDQTNLTVKSRAKKLAKIPKTYEKVAVYFDPAKIGLEELRKRIACRKDKHIPDYVLTNMITQYEAPTAAEGFDLVIDGVNGLNGFVAFANKLEMASSPKYNSWIKTMAESSTNPG